MDKSLLVIISSFIISLIITPLVIIYSIKKGLFVSPGRRRIHKRVTPSLGGIGIFFGFLVASLFSVDLYNSQEVQCVLIFTTLIFALGIIDDLLHLSALKKLIPQLLIIIAFIFLTDIRLSSFYGIIGHRELPYIVSLLVTLTAMVIIINSLNLIDGLDGLAGIISLISSFCFASWFLLTGNIGYSYLLFALFGSISAFILFNWEPSKIFMGDTGSLVIGMVLSFAAIKFINVNYELKDNQYHFEGSITTAICFLSVPLIDTIRIIILRGYKRQSPLKPDKNHIHHAFLRVGASHSQTSLLLGLTHIVFIIIAIIFRNQKDIILLPFVICLSVVLCIILNKKVLKRLTFSK